ncbi:MAG: hypothetical protein Q8M94_11695, partial [Ignavibacteria bacterium]|nr:hypothetical protein [Ignavibacteria bacterium]
MRFRNLLLFLSFMFLLSQTINAQPLTGIKTIDNTGSGDYQTFIAAINALNANGAGSGGVTFLVTDGQTFNSAPLIITATGTADNQIVFKQSGSGVKPIIIFTGSSGTQAGFQLNGSDYVTFDGFDIRDAGTAMEQGFQLYGSASDGCQYNTIKNCIIDLDKTGTNDNGFYIHSNATSFAGTNSYNKFYNNEVKDCFKGYYFYGSSDFNADVGNEISSISGGESKIENIASIGIHIYNQKSFSIKNTTFSNFSYSSTLYGVYIQAGNDNTITISYCNFTSFSGGGDTYAIRSTAGDTLNIYNNNISDISYTGSSSGSAYGLYVSARTTNLYNNMISGVSGSLSTNSTVGSCGIFLNSGITVNMFFNTVLLNYASNVASNKSAALFIPPNNHTSVLFSNNIFINNVIVTTGALAVAFMKGTSGKYIANLSTGSNNNLYYAGIPGPKNLILYDGVNSCQTLTEYKAYVATRSLDQNAITEDVPFVSSSAPYDLHINPSIMTLLESAGIPINSPLVITADIDGDLRNATTPDIGADEGNFLSNDINPPDISYMLLANTESTSNRNLSDVIITDYSGINVLPGTKPRLYYKRFKDSNIHSDNMSATNGWKWVETNSTVSPFEFTIDYSRLYNSGVSAGDVVQYFIVAQDNNSTPNVGINSGTFNSQPVSVTLSSSAFPIIGIINSYSISFAGTYSVGAGYKYTSLTQTGGLFEAISLGSLSGNVEIKITSNLTEDGTQTLSQWQETGSGNYTLTISPSGSNMNTISGSSVSGLIKITACSRVIFDGRYNGNGEYLTVRNANTVSPVFLIANDSKNNILQNLIIESSSTDIDNAAIKLGSGTNLENVIQNCIIRERTDATSIYRHGIYVSGAGNRDTKILNNSIYDFGTAAILLHGGCNNTLIEGNLIYYTHPSQISYVYGIHLRNSTLTKVFRNKIYDLDGSESVHGIFYEGANGVISAQIINNMITLSPTTATTVSGIAYGGYSNNSLTVYHNSVYIGGSLTSGSYNSYAFWKYSSIDVMNLKNNIFVNGRTNLGGTGEHYAIGFNTISGTDNFDYNDYYSVSRNGFYGEWLSTAVTSLTVWRSNSLNTMDAHSIAQDPVFVSNNDLHLNTTVPPYFLAGTPLGITNDYDGDLRHSTFPYIGCDENSSIVLPVEDENTVVTEFALFQNYPNPFNPGTKISYQLPVGGNVTL